MKERCYRTNHHHYADYGGRGIVVCERWKDSFENFLEDMGQKPSSKHTIDRINTNGNYELSNCRWATQKEQNRNKRSTRWIEVDGMHIRLIDAAAHFKISYGVAKARIDRGWNTKQALIAPVSPYR